MEQKLRYLLSGDDITKLAPPDSLVMKQSDLDNFGSLQQIFRHGKFIFILMEGGEIGQNLFGHWVLLIDRGQNGVVFFDPYGRDTDDAYRHYVKGKFREGDYLETLVRRSGMKVDEDVLPLQRVSDGIQTCGRHVVMRAYFPQLSNSEYYGMVNEVAKSRGITPDELVVLYTEKLAIRKR
jgi:hypothetical protein